MKLVVGLGNPEKKYWQTRHNLGWRLIDSLAREIGIDNFKEDKKFNALIAQGEFNGLKIILAKPQTYMNSSGQSVKAISDYFKIALSDIIIAHDEIDLPLGEIKIQEKISSAGHKGVQSVIDCLKTNEFKRVRLGIKPRQETDRKTDDFVLAEFGQDEKEIADQEIKKAAQTIATLLSDSG